MECVDDCEGVTSFEEFLGWIFIKKNEAQTCLYKYKLIAGISKNGNFKGFV